MKPWQIVACISLALAGCHAPAPETGDFVRVRQVDGQDWFEHRGDRFLSLGVNCVQPQDGSTPADGRKYRSRFADDFDAWVADATNRLAAWGFNTVGGWSHEPFYATSGMYHTRVLGLGTWREGDTRLIDVFSPAYAAEMDETARREVAPHADDKMLIGYFVNNELPWYGERGWPTSPTVSMLTRYIRLPDDAPGKQRAIAFLRKYYSDDFAKFSAEWSADGNTFETVTVLEPLIGASMNAAAAWAGIVADQYFRLASDAIRRYDASHLMLGARFAGPAPAPVVAACGKYCDVVSVNAYSKSGEFDARLVDAIAALTGKPVMITEFSWRAMENRSDLKNTHGADVTVQTQRDRADAFRRYAPAALRRPYLVGYHWFQYPDQPPSGRFDGENSNYGLVDIEDQPYEELLAAITEVNGNANVLHADSGPLPEYDPAVLAAYRPVTVRGTNAPLASALIFADSSTPRSIYGDESKGAWLRTEKVPDGIRARFDLRGGWGAGVSFACAICATNVDGSANVLGGSRIRLRMKAEPGATFVVTFNESGHGAPDDQTFDGANGADGEAYTHPPLKAGPEWQDYAIHLRDFTRSPHYGNQRGNSVLDMQALSTIGIMFIEPAAAEGAAVLDQIKLE